LHSLRRRQRQMCIRDSHEGQEGFARGTYRQKPWLMQRARQVRQQADRYRAQLNRCEPSLAA
ncbi:MAG: hypothetical protein H6R23_2939, partial [Proteobacteria bacterium]|nr:hypothetical protein [Pseudomonadota bacterium]